MQRQQLAYQDVVSASEVYVRSFQGNAWLPLGTEVLQGATTYVVYVGLGVSQPFMGLLR